MTKIKTKKKSKKASKAKVAQVPKTNWVYLLIALVAAGAIYFSLFDNEYLNYDDDLYVHENPLIRNMQVGDLFAGPYASQYSPMAMTIMAIQYKISDSLGFIRFSSLLVHLLNVLFIFLVFKNLTKEDWMAGVIALLWAIHPMQVESVAWLAASMKIGTYALFYLFSIWLYLKYLSDSTSKKMLVGSVLTMLLAAMCKEQAVALPLTLLAIDYFKGRNIFSGPVLIEKIPYFAISLIFGLVTLNATSGALDGKVPIVNGENAFGIFDRLILALHSLTAYVQNTLLPLDLSFFYTYPLKTNMPVMVYVNALVTLLLVGVMVWAWNKKVKWLAFGLLFFFINVFFPTLTSLMAVRDVLMADRYMYVPLAGLLFILVYALHAVKGKLPFHPQFIGFALALIFGVLGFLRVDVFQTSETLFSDVIKKESYSQPPLNPHLALAFNNRGIFRKRKGDIKGALADYEMAISSNAAYPNARVGRGNIYFNAGQDDKALEDYNKVADLDPTNGYNLSARGSIFAKRGQNDLALQDLNKAIQYEPFFKDAYSNRALVYLNAGNFAEALKDVDSFLKLSPNDAGMYEMKGVALMNLGRYEEAVTALTKGIGLDSSKPSFYTNRAGAYDALGRTGEAQADRQKAASF